MNWLQIENQGVAPIEAFTQMGDSGTRDRDDDGLIGQFGSGNKLGITMLVRMGHEVKVCCGPNTLQFYPEIAYVTEADGTVRESYPMKCKVSGKINRTLNLGWDLRMGEIDWREKGMALREFISNALDCSKIMRTKPTITQTPNPRAKSGTTRVFVKVDPEVAEYFQNLGFHFLHFSNDPRQVGQRFLKKNPEQKGPNIYREGAWIRTLDSDIPAAFDYNFRAGEIKIDEARNSSEYALRAKIAQAVNIADKDTLKALFQRLSEGDCYEATLDNFYLGYQSGEKEKANWTAAWEEFAGNAVIASPTMAKSPIGDHAKKKGHKVVAVKSDAVAKVAQQMGVQSLTDAIGQHAAQGRVQCKATDEAIEAIRTVWAWCEAVEMTNGKHCPQVAGFKQLMDGECETLGYHTLGTDVVHIREDVGGKLAVKTALEEVAHYVTGSTDLSRDFQNFAFDMIVEVCS